MSRPRSARTTTPTSDVTRGAAVGAAGATLLLVALAGCAGSPTAGAPGSAAPSGGPGAATTSSGWHTQPPTNSGSSAATTPTAPASTPPTAGTTAPSTGSSAPTLIRYDNQTRDELELKRPGDVSQLQGAPQSFKDYLAGLLSKKSDCQYGLTIGVQRLRTDGYAIGGVTECGGYAAIWAIVDGKWQEIIGTQDLWGCAELKKYRVPDSIAGTQCFDARQLKAVPYHQA